MKTLIPKQGNM